MLAGTVFSLSACFLSYICHPHQHQKKTHHHHHRRRLYQDSNTISKSTQSSLIPNTMRQPISYSHRPNLFPSNPKPSSSWRANQLSSSNGLVLTLLFLQSYSTPTQTSFKLSSTNGPTTLLLLISIRRGIYTPEGRRT